MRWYLVTLLVIFLGGLLAYPFSGWRTQYEFSGVPWESNEVIIRQNPETGTSDFPSIPTFHSINTYITLIFLEDGTFTASITAAINYDDGLVKSLTQEVTGAWVRQGRYVDMKIENHNPIIGDVDDQIAIDWIEYYEKIHLYQTYSVNYYKKALVLISLHAGGPVLAFSKQLSEAKKN